MEVGAGSRWSALWRSEEAETTIKLIIWAVRVFSYPLVGVLVFGPVKSGGDRAVLAACYALCVLALAVYAVVDFRPPSRVRGEWLLPVVWGITAVAGGFGATVASGGPLVAFAAAAAMTAGTELSMTAAWTVAGAGVLAIEIGAVIYGPSPGNLLGFPLLVLMGLLIGRNRHAYRVQAQQSAELLDQYQRLRDQQRRADVLDERTRIAREIHDVLAHSLGALGIQVQAAKAVLTDSGDVPQAVELLTAAQRMASQGLTETRRAIHTLRSDVLPLDGELAAMVEAHVGHHAQPVDYRVTGTPRELTPEAAVGLLRIAQEALVNAAKHAQGEPVTVHLDYRPAGLGLTITNPIPETPAGPPRMVTVDGGYGLTGMRERLLLLGGTLTVGPAADGWRVAAELTDEPEPRG